MSAALQSGSQGADVRKLQEDLNSKVSSLNLKIDGIFGPKTKAGVEKFQKMCGLKVDGIAGGKTLSALLPAGTKSSSEPNHVVTRGESLNSICKKNNNCDPKAIWEHPANKDLRNSRIKPDMIRAGDTVVMPAELTAAEVECHVCKFEGKSVSLTQAEYDRAVAETGKKLARLAEVFYSHHQSIEATVREMLASASGANGMLEAFVAFTSAKVAGVDIPEFKTQSKSYAAVLAARSACNKKNNLDASRKSLNDAQTALRSFERDVSKYREKIIGGATSITSGLELTRDTSFAVAEVLSTAVLTVKTGGNYKVASTSSSAIFAAIKSGATEVGEHLADPKRTWNQSAQNIVVDTAVATGASVISNGFKGDFVAKLASKASAKIMTDKVMKILGPKVTQELVEKLLTDSGQKILKDGMSEALKEGGEMAKKGRVITKDEAKKKLNDYVVGLVGGQIVKRLKGGTWKFARSLEVTLVDSKAKQLGDWYLKLGDAQRAKVMHDIFAKNEEAIVGFGMQNAPDWISSAMSEDAIAKKAEKEAMSNKRLMDLLCKEIEKARKSGKVKV